MSAFYRTLRTNGFSLIELMVVVTIVAILSVVGISSYSNAQRTARDRTRVSNIQDLQTSLELYRQRNDEYPDDMDDLDDPLYIAKMHVDPITNAVYSYTKDSDVSYTLCANLEADSLDDDCGEQDYVVSYP